MLGAAIQRIAARGTVVSYASTVSEPVGYPTRALFGQSPGAKLYGLLIFPELQHTRSGTSDLTRLAERIAAGRLDVRISLQDSWRAAGRAVQALLDGDVRGKAVLTVD